MATDGEAAPAATPTRQRRVVTAGELKQAIQVAGAKGKIASLSARSLDLKHLEVGEIEVVDCDFSGAQMQSASLAGATFKGCLFQQSNLDGANLVGTQFIEKCDFSGADLKGAEGQNAKFLHANMENATASGAKFPGADFGGSNLKSTDLRLADLRQARNLLPDETLMRGAWLSSSKADPWSVLRRTYTGPRLLLNLVPVGLFAATLALKVGTLYIAGRVQHAEVLGAGVTRYCKRPEAVCQSYDVWQLLAGFHEGLGAVGFVLLSLVYNGLRFFLTLYISSLREQEDRTGATPAHRGAQSYGWTSTLHYYVFMPLWVVMLVFFAGNFVALLMQDVILIR